MHRLGANSTHSTRAPVPCFIFVCWPFKAAGMSCNPSSSCQPTPQPPHHPLHPLHQPASTAAAQQPQAALPCCCPAPKVGRHMRITPDTVRPPTVLTALRPTSRKESTSTGICWWSGWQGMAVRTCTGAKMAASVSGVARRPPAAQPPTAAAARHPPRHPPSVRCPPASPRPPRPAGRVGPA